MFNNLKFKYKILVLPIIAAGVLLCILSITKEEHKRNEILLDKFKQGYIPALEMTRDVQATLERIQRDFQDAISTSDEELIEETDALRNTSLSRIQGEKSNIVIEANELDALEQVFQDYYTLARKTATAMIGGNMSTETLMEMTKAHDALRSILEEGTQRRQEEMEQILNEAQTQDQEGMVLFLWVTGISLLVMVSAAIWMSKSFGKPLRKLIIAAEKVAAGELSAAIQLDRTDEIGLLANSFGKMVDALKEAAAQQSGKMSQLSSMIENASFNIMFADNDDKISYMNPASLETLKKIEHVLPCRAEEVVGQSIDIFYNNPERQRNLLTDSNNLLHTTNIPLGDEVIEIATTAIFDKDKARIGTMANWQIVTVTVRLSESLSETAAEMSRTSESLSTSSQLMSTNAQKTTDQASRVTESSEKTNSRVQTVASSAEEMSATINQITKSVNDTNQITSKAVQMVHDTNRTVTRLRHSSTEIGKVIKLISSIAGQTNLLALNATIESARAGEAGKGFSVVANEVKNLAKETAEAADEISRQIRTVQDYTTGVVSGIEEIGQIIKQINENSISVAQAMEEQSVTTNEISRNMVESAQGTGEVVKYIGDISHAAKETTNGAHVILSSSQELSNMASRLEVMLEEFKT